MEAEAEAEVRGRYWCSNLGAVGGGLARGTNYSRCLDICLRIHLLRRSRRPGQIVDCYVHREIVDGER